MQLNCKGCARYSLVVWFREVRADPNPSPNPDPSQEGRVTIANAQLEMHKGEVERALTMLRAIQTSSASSGYSASSM